MEEENEEEEEEAAAPNEEEEGVPVGAISLAEKKTERQRKKEKAEKIKVHARVWIPNPSLSCWKEITIF